MRSLDTALRACRLGPSRIVVHNAVWTPWLMRNLSRSRSPSPTFPGPLQLGPARLRSVHSSATTDLSADPQLDSTEESTTPTLPTTFSRAVLIHGLDPATTLADITTGIRDTAPVGMVREVRFKPTKPGLPGLSCSVLFHSFDAAVLLVKAAQAGVLKIKDTNPYACIMTLNSNYSTPGKLSLLDSRVLQIRGHPDAFQSITPMVIRNVLHSDPRVMAIAGSLGVQSEPVTMQTTKTEEGTDMVTMVWPFFSHPRQARPFLAALRRAFDNRHLPPNKRLWIAYGRDPCFRPAKWDKNEIDRSQTLTDTDGPAVNDLDTANEQESWAKPLTDEERNSWLKHIEELVAASERQFKA